MVGDREWREIYFGGMTGWVNAQFLAQATSPRPDLLPERMSCTGTEPFWSLQFQAGDVRIETADDTRSFTAAPPRTPVMNRNRKVMEMSDDSGGEAVAMLMTGGICWDGMSDINYPIEILWVDTSRGDLPLSGCCYGG